MTDERYVDNQEMMKIITLRCAIYYSTVKKNDENVFNLILNSLQH